MSEQELVYLDYAATAPMLDVAKKACLDGFQAWANPSSPHRAGRSAQAWLEQARGRIAKALNWPHDIIFTSGASEATAIAVKQSKAAVQIISPVEHDAVIRLLPSASHLKVDSCGRVDPDDLRSKLSAYQEPVTVAIQSVNNETGVMQDLASLAAIIKEHGSYLLTDCAQSAAKMPLPDADMIIVAAHKFGGPPGVGALLIKDLKLLNPVGGQETGYRPGTQNLPYILAMAAALEAPVNWAERAIELRSQLDRAIEQSGGIVIAAQAPRIATIGSYAMPHMNSNVQLIQFDTAGFLVSAGSACSSGTLKESHVLSAMGLEKSVADNVIRVSIGRETTRAHIYAFVEQWQKLMRGAAPTG